MLGANLGLLLYGEISVMEREATQFYKSGKVIIELHISICLLEWIYN